MLILTRKRGQALYINDDITITVREVGNDNVRLAIDAPKEVKILREELVEAMKQVSGQNVIVENVTGGSTGIGTNQVIDSDPDGYTLLMYGTYVICGTMTATSISLSACAVPLE